MKRKWHESIDLHIVFAGLIVFLLLLGAASIAREPHWPMLPLGVVLVQELMVLPMIFTQFGDLRRRDPENSGRYLFWNLLFVQLLAALVATYCLQR